MISMIFRSILTVGIACSATSVFAGEATPAEKINIQKGFKVEMIYEVPREEQGSWVSMTVDTKGRMITSDQYGKLYRITPAGINNASEVKIEKIDLEIGMAQGLLYAFDSLYVMVSSNDKKNPSGFFRVKDTNNDDQFDKVELLRTIPGKTEHGPHAIILSPDGKSLYVCAGNATGLPEPEKSLVPKVWEEDQIIPRMWDARGHAAGRLAPAGWVCKTDPDGKEFELISMGFRNQYDIAFNAEGELFTYDADMEWDVGTPWYRPTRVCHVTPGSEFGWRSGTGKWPAHYPDSLPAAVDIGQGSPTGIVFGTGAKFPKAHQNALYIADWSYGIIYAVELKPDGSTYKGTAKEFVSAAPLPVTDMIINPADGAMYFTIGGRKTQSALYKVTYIGDESTKPAEAEIDPLFTLRQKRRELEALIDAPPSPKVVAEAWPFLSHSDRFIRFAARTVIEMQPVDSWRFYFEKEPNPQGIMTGAIALARTGTEKDRALVFKKLSKINWNGRSESQKLDLIRCYALALIRLGDATDEQKETVINKLNPHFPSQYTVRNQELCRVLASLNPKGFIARSLKLLADAETQEQQIHYAYCLRPVISTGTEAQQKEYFRWFNKAARHRGGMSFGGFISNIRKEALEKLTDEQKAPLKKILEYEAPKDLVAVDPTRKHVKKWTVAELLPKLEAEDSTKNRDLKRGRKVFAAVGCYKCHRLKGQGGTAGPDLTTVGRRFNNRVMLESLIEPSKEVSDQYQTMIFVTTEGKSITGRIVNLSGDEYRLMTNMLDPGAHTRISRKKILKSMASTTSMMPVGLLDTLTEEEILDLIAYLKAEGMSAFKVGQN